MSKPITSGLTPSRRKKERAALALCFDAVNDHWHALHALTGLLALCQETSARVVEAKVVGEAAYLIEQELDKLRASIERLEKEVAP